MSQIVLYGGLTGFALLFGAMIGIIFRLGQKMIARFMAFGSGVLICALTFGLMEEAFNHGGFDAVIIGFLAGGLAYILGDYILHQMGGRHHKHKPVFPIKGSANGAAITLGAILDGVPESIALGIALFAGQGKGLLMLVAIVLSNFPEGIASITGLKKEGFSNRKIIFIWIVVGVAVALVSIGSFAFLHDVNLNTIGILEAFAAGAILAMLADTMMPEAYEEGGFTIGILTILGFLTAFVISRF